MLYLKKRENYWFMQLLPNKTVADNINNFDKEKDFYRIWTNFCEQNTLLDSVNLRGIESGELNELEGPDFQGAEFELDGKIYRGDVEIHKECVEWKKHGHHLDQRYDRVVLHLVASQKMYPVLNSKDQKIPSISLLDFPMHNGSLNCSQNCEYLSQTMEPSLFQDLAIKRMSSKSFEIYELVSSLGIDQTLYSLILKTLGNVINKNNYERLAQLIPWKLVHLLKEKNNPPEFWIALYLGTAGLLNDQYDLNLTKHWKNILPLIEGAPLKRENWKWGGVRPNNFPQNRLIGLALFVWQLKEPSIYIELENLFYRRYPKEKIINGLNSLFNTNIIKNKLNDFWGQNLILELIGNVFIPLFYKLAIINNSFGFQMYLKQLYLELPASQNYGRLKSLMSQLKINKPISRNFYFNQALLHLQNNYCSSFNFNICPLQTIQQKN
jgi:uncharacterized protein DUF2851